MNELEKHAMLVPEIANRIDEVLRGDERVKQLRAEALPNGRDRMSAAGRCYRERWANGRGIPLDDGKGFHTNPRLLRIFRLGHIIEDEVVALLEDAGYFVSDTQLEVGVEPWVGHIDGIIHIGEPIPTRSLLEIKSANASRFDLLKSLGYEEWNPGYSAQLHAYMHHLPGIEDAIVVVYNKDTSELYCERILFDLDVALRLEKETALATAEGKMPPPRPKSATSKSCKFCRWCDRAEWCWSAATEVEFDD